MALTRRTLIGSAAAGSALAALPDLATPAPAAAASPPGDVVGKITVGYQGWFSCLGDGAPIGGWWHWSRDRFQPPSPTNTTIVSWPDMRDYVHGYPTAYPDLGDGQPARLFSSYDQQTVDTHLRCYQVTLGFPATATRYVRVHVTGNTGWPAGQLSQLEVYAA
ncbi:hypothetical protein [Micromonospora avicenniae]|uniref:hypothetical protein n=1 Tax=Micromonospora avicenniae TaxID=1198245 RepID=UPI0033346A10